MFEPDHPLLVPVRSASDVGRVGPIAAQVANAYELPIDFVRIATPEENPADELRDLIAAVEPLVDELAEDVRVRLVMSEQTGEQFLDLCTGQIVCMATSASPFDHEHFVGSHAAGLLARSAAPVVLIGPSVPEGPLAPIDEVVAAVSGDAESNAVLPHARRLAEVLQVGVSKVHVDPESGTVYETHYEAAAEYLPESVHATVGSEPADASAITDTLIERSTGALLAVATHARNGLAWIAEGSIAFDAIRRLTTPVLAVGPNIDGLEAVDASPSARTVMALRSNEREAAATELVQRLASGEVPDEYEFSFRA